MKNFIKKALRENLDLEFLRTPENITLSDEEKSYIKNINWSDLKIEQGPGSKIIPIFVTIPQIPSASDGIATDIQITSLGLFQIHITLAQELRGLGLSYKIYKAIIMTYGHLFSGIGRRMNDVEVPKIWNKLAQDSDITCKTSDLGNICISNQAPNKDELLNIIT